MTQSLITSAVSESKIGHIKDLLTPVLRRLLKDDSQAQAIIEAGDTLHEQFSAVVSGLLAKLTKTFMVTVDYARGLPEMIKAGKYDYANDDITAEHFPIVGEGKQGLEILLVHFGKDMESNDVLSELGKLGLRPATLPELLAFGETHPEIQREFPIIALGSVWQNRDGSRHVPYLGGWCGGRELFLIWFGDRWSGDCRFAAVRK